VLAGFVLVVFTGAGAGAMTSTAAAAPYLPLTVS
jgi:hypothetical protein